MHAHTSRVIDWKLDINTNYVPKLYGCTDCDITSDIPLSNGNIVEEHTHTSYVDGCFACKLPTLQLSTGDANSGLVNNGWSNKKWDSELDLYRKARAQGIQPEGTSTAQIQKAMDVSDKTGHAYGSDL
jgi:hypothetical protein